MQPRRFIIVGLLTGLFLFVGSQARAHRPLSGSETGVTTIPSLSTSYAFYQQLATPGQVDVYAFEGRAGEFFHAGINIPRLARLEDYGVSLALVGPGLPALDPARLPRLSDGHADHDHGPGPLPAGLTPNDLTGIVAPSQVGEPFYEPFTQTRYWGRQTLELDLPASGTYRLIIWQPAGQTGKYVLDTGYEEVFGPGDMLRFPIWWLNTRLYFEQGPVLLAIGGLLVLAVVGGLVLARRRQSQRILRPAPLGGKA